MTYRVILQRLAIQDLDDAFVWAARKAPATAARWLDCFQAALQRLDTNPQYCQVYLSWPRADAPSVWSRCRPRKNKLTPSCAPRCEQPPPALTAWRSRPGSPLRQTSLAVPPTSFVGEQIANGGASLTPAEALNVWEILHPSDTERAATVEA